MLRKLLKHEFRATSGYMALMCAGLIGFAGLTRLLMLLDDLFGLFSLPLAIAMFFYVVLAIASAVLIYVIIIKRFYSNVYGDEGYLTLTLPVKRSKIILSKLICGVVWIIVDVVVTLGSVCILAFSEDFVSIANEAFYYIGGFITQFIKILNTPTALLAAELIIMVIIGLVNSVLVFYAAISIGQLFTKHRFIGSVAGYMMVTAAQRVITSVLGLLFGVTMNDNNNLMANGFENITRSFAKGIPLDGILSFNLQVYIISYLVVYAVITAGLFALTNLIMKRAVNLQ